MAGTNEFAFFSAIEAYVPKGGVPKRGGGAESGRRKFEKCLPAGAGTKVYFSRKMQKQRCNLARDTGDDGQCPADLHGAILQNRRHSRQKKLHGGMSHLIEQHGKLQQGGGRWLGWLGLMPCKLATNTLEELQRMPSKFSSWCFLQPCSGTKYPSNRSAPDMCNTKPLSMRELKMGILQYLCNILQYSAVSDKRIKGGYSAIFCNIPQYQTKNTLSIALPPEDFSGTKKPWKPETLELEIRNSQKFSDF